MATTEILKERLAFRESAYSKLTDAYLALLDGGVKSYTIDDRTLTRFDLPELKKEIESLEKQIDQLTLMIDGGKPRRAVGIIPRDW